MIECEHDYNVSIEDDYSVDCGKCGHHLLPCTDCAWASLCILAFGGCKKEHDERTAALRAHSAATDGGRGCR